MKFTTLEPLNQRINEVLNKHGLKTIQERSNIPRVINECLNDRNNTVERMFDEFNESCSQVFVKVKNGNIKYANVFITDKDEPDYDLVFIVT